MNPNHDFSAAITIGDPTGIGPEIIARFFQFQNDRLETPARCLVVGRAAIMQRASDLVQSGLRVVEYDFYDDVHFEPGTIPLLQVGPAEADSLRPGQVCSAAGLLAYEALKTATQLALAGQVDAIVTAPLNKKSLNAAGITVPGHTELLAEFCDVDQVAMMLHLPQFRSADQRIQLGEIGLSVVHVTLHTALRNVFEELSVSNVREKCILANEFCQSLLSAKNIERKPRIGVAALNPHGGENGLFGQEESEIIRPAVDWCQQNGIHAVGPEPCDTLMRRAALGEFDAVVAMYHDQGHIALKLIDMFGTVNVTLGLPVIRTSVAHGTADAIAWTGVADEQSLVQAVQVAQDLVIAKEPSRFQLRGDLDYRLIR